MCIVSSLVVILRFFIFFRVLLVQEKSRLMSSVVVIGYPTFSASISCASEYTTCFSHRIAFIFLPLQVQSVTPKSHI